MNVCPAGVVHVTTIHHRDDTRIRVKELDTLTAAYSGPFTLLVADGLGNREAENGSCRIVDVGRPPGGRLGRVLLGNWRMFCHVRNVRPTIVHFHDPELIVLGLVLSVVGYRVIYDVHEDVPRQILTKPWLIRPLRRPVAWITAGLEWMAGRWLAGVVAATPLIVRRFPAEKVVLVQNFPVLSEFSGTQAVPYGQRPPDFAYVGTIEAVRGAREMVRAMHEMLQVGSALRLAGEIRPASLEVDMRAEPGWPRVAFHGWAARSEVAEILGSVRAGLVVLHPTPGYLDAYPVKMFEYMACGLPVIASDFPLWRQIIDDARCGLLVDPLDPHAIADAMQWILDHPEEAEAMGERGRTAVRERYNWDHEAEKLLGLYRRLMPWSVSASRGSTEAPE